MTKALSQSDLVAALEGIVGSHAVNDSEHARWTYALSEAWSTVSPGLTDDLYLDLGPPDVIVKPKTTEHVVEIVKLANTYKIPLIPRGGGTGNASGSAALASGGIMLDLLDMNSFIKYDSVSRACRFQAGISWGKLCYELKKLGLTPGFMGPHGMYGAAVGGGVSIDSTGIQGTKYGQENENVQNLQVVLPTGDIIETGSLANTMTDWYFRYCNGPDLAGLFMGASGAFGVITEITLRTYPLPEYHSDFLYLFPSEIDQCKALMEMDSYELMNDYMGLAQGFQYAIIENVFRLKPGTTQKGPALIHSSAYDEVILERKKVMLDKIADKYKALKFNGDPTSLGISAHDTNEMLGGGVCKFFGGMMHKTCSVLPLMKCPEFNEWHYRFFKNPKVESLLSTTGLGNKCWSIQYPGGCKHGFVLHMSMFNIDATTRDLRTKAYKIWHEILKQKIEMGTAPYWVGKDAFMPHLNEKFSPQYLNFLKSIKKMFDPNNIMNPGALGLGLD
ncbi:MAG TPA: FAD-binding oxidoreductase [Candidatus Deferrimicrobium sp.]|nr:FAD-binding oxidoreductase [Candidatus Deferrimicrobium sp.]